MSKLTVGFPLYRSKDIAWLALESLCRQKGVDFKWELIVIEEIESEKHSPLGKAKLLLYEERLKKAGCERIIYKPIKKWITLFEKWAEMGRLADDNSVGFLLQAADCYSQPYRLKETLNLFEKNNSDWIHSAKGVFFNIKTNKIAVFDTRLSDKTALNMAVRTSLIKQIPYLKINKSVDHHLLIQLSKVKKLSSKSKYRHKAGYKEIIIDFNKSDNWNKGFDSHGANQISSRRWTMIEKRIYKNQKKNADVPPWSPWTYSYDFWENIPNDIEDKIKNMKL